VRVDSRIAATPGMRLGHAVCRCSAPGGEGQAGRLHGGDFDASTPTRTPPGPDSPTGRGGAGERAAFAETERRRRESLAPATSQTLAQSLHPGAVAQRVVDTVRIWWGAGCFRVPARSRIGRAGGDRARAGRARRPPLRYPRGTGAVGWWRRSGGRWSATSPRRSPAAFAPDVRAFIERSQIRAIVAVPLIVKERSALGLVTGRPRSPPTTCACPGLRGPGRGGVENARPRDAERRRVEAGRGLKHQRHRPGSVRAAAAAGREPCEATSPTSVSRRRVRHLFARYGWAGRRRGRAPHPAAAGGRPGLEHRLPTANWFDDLRARRLPRRSARRGRDPGGADQIAVVEASPPRNAADASFDCDEPS
jgi:hypothetical protein